MDKTQTGAFEQRGSAGIENIESQPDGQVNSESQSRIENLLTGHIGTQIRTLRSNATIAVAQRVIVIRSVIKRIL